MSRQIRFAAVAVLAAAFLVSSCGGGGGSDGGNRVPSGGGGTPGASSYSLVNLNIPPRDPDVFEGEPFDVAAGGDLAGDLTALAGRALYVLVEDPQQHFSHAYVTIGPNGTGNAMTVQGRQNLPPGSISGSLRVSLCLDPACTELVRNTPVTLPYAVNILRPLKVDTTPIVLDAMFGSAAQATVAVTLPEGVDSWLAHVEAGNFQNLTFSSSQSDTPTPNVQVRGEPTCVGTFTSRLSIYAIAQTASGRRVPMNAYVPLTYRVAPGAPGTMLIESDRSSFSVNSTDRPGESAVLSALRQSCNRSSQLIKSVEFLPPGPSGNLDAGAARWLSYDFLPDDGQRLRSRLTARRCVDVFPDPPQPAYRACLAPGRYDAIVHVIDYHSDGTEVLVPFPVSMTVEM
jgi:hypothetical protein